VLAFMSGNLCYQIEHHLYPDLPSNRLPEIAERVRALCLIYDLPYTTDPLLRQYLLTMRTICKLALPDRFLLGYLRRRTRDSIREQVPECRGTIAHIRYRARWAATRMGDSDTDPR